MNSVEIDFDDITAINFYKELKEEFGNRIKEISFRRAFYYMCSIR